MEAINCLLKDGAEGSIVSVGYPLHLLAIVG
jgi:hypothetical protein